MDFVGGHIASVNPLIRLPQETRAPFLALVPTPHYQTPSRFLPFVHIGPPLRAAVSTFAARSVARLAFIGEAKGAGLIAQEIVSRGFHRQVAAIAASCGHNSTMVDGPHKGKDILR